MKIVNDINDPKTESDLSTIKSTRRMLSFQLLLNDFLRRCLRG